MFTVSLGLDAVHNGPHDTLHVQVAEVRGLFFPGSEEVDGTWQEFIDLLLHLVGEERK